MFLLFISGLYIVISIYDVCSRKIPNSFPFLIALIGLGILVINGDWLEGLTTVGLAVGNLPGPCPALHGGKAWEVVMSS